MAGIRGGGAGLGVTMELGTDVHGVVGVWITCIILVAQASTYRFEVVAHASSERRNPILHFTSSLYAGYRNSLFVIAYPLYCCGLSSIE